MILAKAIGNVTFQPNRINKSYHSRYRPPSCLCDIRLWDCDNRQRVILIVHLRLNTITLS